MDHSVWNKTFSQQREHFYIFSLGYLNYSGSIKVMSQGKLFAKDPLGDGQKLLLLPSMAF